MGVHMVLEFLQETKIKSASPSGAVWWARRKCPQCFFQALRRDLGNWDHQLYDRLTARALIRQTHTKHIKVNDFPGNHWSSALDFLSAAPMSLDSTLFNPRIQVDVDCYAPYPRAMQCVPKGHNCMNLASGRVQQRTRDYRYFLITNKCAQLSVPTGLAFGYVV